jgi:5-methylcytosine-specific restriction endonuclease McrA
MELANDICRNCNGKIVFVETPELTHYGKMICSNCGLWVRWVRHPEKEGKRTKTSIYKMDIVKQFYGIEEEFCFFCLRKKHQLGVCEVMTLDHIQELDKGGADEPQNIQILCTACHKLKNWARLYTNWHYQKANKEEDVE